MGADRYRAPEINGGVYLGEPADIFSCGVILFVMLTGKPPFNMADDMDHRRILRMPVRTMKLRRIQIEENAIDLFNKMTCIDPKARFTIAQIKAHPWMTSAPCATELQVAQYYDHLIQEK